ncbi:MAG: molybdopterin-dependent oxidoreductase, partial [Myxococcales bacterium]|nr:molybdopterin-dependent oxidoreductase [Myxococcales bacterium]
SDPLLVAAMLQTLFAEGLVRLGRVEGFTDGVEELGRRIAPFTPEAVAGRVGMDAQTIRRIAREFAGAERAVAYGRIGTSTVAFGATATWLVECLNVVTGNLDREGGMMFPGPSSAVNALSLLPPSKRGRWRSRTRGTPEFMGELPAATLADEMTTPGAGQIRALLTIAGNPVLSSPAGHRLAEALGGLDFMVAVDFYLNETTRHAHVILPPVGPLEHDHFDLIFQLVAVRATARWSPKVFDAPEGTRTDAEILLELGRRLRWARGGAHRAKALGYRAMLALGAERTVGLMMDYVLRSGPRGAGFKPFGEGLSLKRVRDSVHGIDLGPLEPCLPKHLPAKSKRIDLAPQELREDLGRLRAVLEDGSEPGLVLIGRRHVRTNNSWSHNLPSLVKGPDRCTLLIHPTDAAARGVGEGDRVADTSRVGSVEVPAELDDGMMPGVVSLPHGYGHGAEGARMKVAREHAGVSINDLTDPKTLAHLLKYDTVSGRYPGKVAAGKDWISVDGNKIQITAERDPAKLPHKANKIDFVVESTGVFSSRADCQKHLDAGAKKVLLTVPPKDAIDAMIVMGVNQESLKPEDKIISNASCTTNCLVPVVKVLNDAIGIDHGFMTTIHSYTGDQPTLDT